MAPPLLPPRIEVAGGGGLFDVRAPPMRSWHGVFVGVLVGLVGTAGLAGGYCLGTTAPAVVVAAPMPVLMPSAASRAPEPAPPVAPAAPSASAAKRPAWAVAPPPSTAWRRPAPPAVAAAPPPPPSTTAAPAPAGTSEDDRLLEEMRRSVAKKD